MPLSLLALAHAPVAVMVTGVMAGVAASLGTKWQPQTPSTSVQSVNPATSRGKFGHIVDQVLFTILTTVKLITMSKIDIKVHCLPTEKASGSILIPNSQHRMEWKLATDIFWRVSDRYKQGHLYATTSEAPKEGDIIIVNNELNKVLSCTDGYELKSLISGVHWLIHKFHTGLKGKVVATTDPDLWYNIDTYTNDVIDDYPDTLVAKIFPEFQAAWIKEANKGTPIVDAMMEIEYKCDNDHVMAWRAICTYPHCNKENYSVSKLNSQGFVTILPIKEKMYSKDDLFLLQLKAAAWDKLVEAFPAFGADVPDAKQIEYLQGMINKYAPNTVVPFTITKTEAHRMIQNLIGLKDEAYLIGLDRN